MVDSNSKSLRLAVQRKVSSTGSRTREAADQSDLPPISDIPKMLDDLVSQAGKLGDLVDRLNGRKLRVATMCSETGRLEEEDEDENDESDLDGPKTNADLIWDLREKTHHPRRLEKELVGRVRSLREFEGVLICKSRKALCRSMDVLSYSAKINSLANISILSSCGRMGCHACLSESAGEETCPIEGCRVAAVISSVVRATTSGEEDTAVGRYFWN